MNSATTAKRSLLGVSILSGVLTLAVASVALGSTERSWKDTVEADWLAYEQTLLLTNAPANVTPADDAAGGCDGVIDGRWGFHTGQENGPWWRVDLGARAQIGSMRVWNRGEATDRAARLMVRLSDDDATWRTVYQHDGSVFQGYSDKKPLVVSLTNAAARYVRIELPGNTFLHLDEVEVIAAGDAGRNLALRRPALQSSVSQWSVRHRETPRIDWAARTRQSLAMSERLLSELPPQRTADDLAAIRSRMAQLSAIPAAQRSREHFLAARWIQRSLALRNPLLDVEALLITKRLPGSFNHMSDQYYGWWSRPGGGLYLLRNFRSENPTLTCLTESFKEPGSFLRPALSYDAKKVLFAWCRHYPQLAAEKNKLNKANVPEDAFYHIYEMELSGGRARQLTHGKYDDFDARYLPDGRIVFLSTRRGQFVQADRDTAAQTMVRPDLPDCYVRCGGDAERPVAVYTLHTMGASGDGITAISPFEMFEWEPSVANDGSVLYARWDYIDRDNMPYMSLWRTRPDGSGARLVYGNFSRAPHCVFEPRSIPNSHKIVFTASGHHSQTMGSLVLLDPSVHTEGSAPMTRLTPEVCFPEIEGWPVSYYANPWPLSERHYLAAWGVPGAKHPGPEGWNRWHAVPDALKDFGIVWFDAAGQLETLYRDSEFSCMYPMPVQPREVPPSVSDQVDWASAKTGTFLLNDVYAGLSTVRRGEIKSVRVVAVPPKTHPVMNFPNLGITADDPGKCVLGTVPVEEDGSACFQVPSGVTLFFQALDAEGFTVRTMRSATHVQPGQTVGCVGCHESRLTAAPNRPSLAAAKGPQMLRPAPEGAWPFRFDRLVQPVLDRQCVECHTAGSKEPEAARLPLTADKSYGTLVAFGKPSLRDQVWGGYRHGASPERESIARRSALIQLLAGPRPHHKVQLTAQERERLVTWIDLYAQRIGAFSDDQEKELERLKRQTASLGASRQP